jgi:hypothetical protein
MKLVNTVEKIDYKVLNQNVHIHQAITKTLKPSVSLVMSNVKNVPYKLITVLLVLVTEFLNLSVTVQMVPFKILKKLSAQLVTNIVFLVLEPQKIVYNVFQSDTTHQSVHLFHNLLNLLKLLIFQ